MIKQVSIFLENRAGRVAEITEMLAGMGINLDAISIADTESYGILRIIVENPEQTCDFLRKRGVTATLTDVLDVNVRHEPGGLARILKIFADNSITIEYIYTSMSTKDGYASIIIRVEHPEEAEELLRAAGYTLG
ncbi:MAG: ACT domain-containing protein [Eubacteriales bacterium]|jgi:hypothetical protein|nr:ACT domain-containing protein [Clostridiales bacterium]